MSSIKFRMDVAARCKSFLPSTKIATSFSVKFDAKFAQTRPFAFIRWECKQRYKIMRVCCKSYHSNWLQEEVRAQLTCHKGHDCMNVRAKLIPAANRIRRTLNTISGLSHAHINAFLIYQGRSGRLPSYLVDSIRSSAGIA